MMADPPRSGFNDNIGMSVELQPDGVAVVTAQIAPHHLNYEGSVHGGVLSALADVAMARAIRAAVEPTKMIMTVNLSVSFVGRATAGLLRAEGHVVTSSRSMAFARAEIRESDRLIAYGQGAWYVRDRK